MAESFFERVHKQDTHTPDVLSCLANLSNDEVFTPPELVNKVLDMLPQELFKDPNTKFLDPATKTGVFLREIAKRLLIGLEPIYPDLQERIDHIFHEQLYGIAITELTSLLARRSLYCSKYPNGKYSICHFDNAEGNISFKKIPHIWKDRKCIFCGASQAVWDREDSLETYAYGFIHCNEEHNKELFERLKSMKFDVIIGNPPYQLQTKKDCASSINRQQATPLYHFFVEQAKQLQPHYISMIIPSRWFSGGMGSLKKFRASMLKDTSIRVLHDFLNEQDCFPGIDVKGGVCYFLWDKAYHGPCKVFTHQDGIIFSSAERFLQEDGENVFIRYNSARPILNKIKAQKEKSLTAIIQPLSLFGFPTSFSSYEIKPSMNTVKIYGRKFVGYISRKQLKAGLESVDKIKVLLPEAIGDGGFNLPLKPIITEKNSCCTATYVVIGSFDSVKEAQGLVSYINTSFFKFLVGLRKITQHATQDVYSFVPVQDFTQEWTDAKLYKKYGLTKEEINFIESMIKPMEDK